MNKFSQYLAKLKAEKIKNHVIESSPDKIDERYVFHVSYNERKDYTFQQRYRRRYHFNEIFNRIFCREKNKPEQKEIEKIRSLLNGFEYSKDNIYRVTKYKQRKHLNYIHAS